MKQLPSPPFTTVIALFVSSLALAIWLENSTKFWQFIQWLPSTIKDALVYALIFILTPIWPDEVFEQEELIDFFMAWFVSGVVVIAIYLGWRNYSACRNAQSS